jgi:predicted amidophosphoribosyltransferase
MPVESINVVSGGHLVCPSCAAEFYRLGDRCPACGTPLSPALVKIVPSRRPTRALAGLARLRRFWRRSP